MNVSKASKQELKNIIEWDSHCPTILLYQIFEEAVTRDLYKYFIVGCIIKYFKSTDTAERLMKMNADEIKWLCYEKGFEALEKFKAGNRPFIALWSRYIKYSLKDHTRDMQAQKRTADLIDIDHVGDWILPTSHLNTEKTALNRIYIASLLDKLSETEKEIALKRFEGYTLVEIAKMQGISKGGVQRRIETYVKRLKEVAV
jgi:RNA polymerase sigma factor (sigma-70 family)